MLNNEGKNVNNSFEKVEKIHEQIKILLHFVIEITAITQEGLQSINQSFLESLGRLSDNCIRRQFMRANG